MQANKQKLVGDSLVLGYWGTGATIPLRARDGLCDGRGANSTPISRILVLNSRFS